MGEYSGIVTNIGVKSTRLKLLQGEELIVSNKELTNASVRNFRKLEKRRITFAIGVTYDTPLQKLKKIPQIITDIIKSIDTAGLERVHFTEFGDCSLKFLISYYAMPNTLIRNNKSILQLKRCLNVTAEMAFPTRTVHIKK